MNEFRPIVFVTLLIPWAVFLFLPRLTPRRYFFGITVAPEFSQSENGRAIRRGYFYVVIAALALAIACTAAFPQAAIGAVLLAPAAGLGAFFWARDRAARFALQGAMATQGEITRGPSSPPWWTLIALPAFAIPLGVAAYLGAHWDEIPARFAVHWGMDGRPNRWVERTPHGVYGPLWFGIVIMAFMAVIGLAVFYGSHRSPMRIAMLKMVLAVMYLLAFVFGMVGLLPLRLFPPMALIAPLPVFVGVVLIYAFRISSDPEMPVDATPDSCWHLSSIYYNPSDPALMVQKRIGFGYTLNFGNPLSWLLMGVTLALFPAAIWLLR